MTVPTAPRAGSLCSGIGGIDLGLQRAGWQIAWQAEIDPYCLKVLGRHWPDVPKHHDLREITPDDLEPVDLVAAGFPCQPVSLAGQGRAQDDPRWLWPDVARLVRGLRPRWVLLENVPGLLGRGLGDVLGDLAEAGYDAEWSCVAAADVGAPHLRNRVWVLAYPAGVGFPSGPRGAGGPVRDDSRGTEPGRLGGDRRAVADPGGAGLEVVQLQPPGAQRATVERGRHPGARREPESVLGGVLDGLPARVDGYRWPAPPGQPQHPWELPRTVGRGLPNRPARVRALGNAVVPQVVELIGRAILTTHQQEGMVG